MKTLLLLLTLLVSVATTAKDSTRTGYYVAINAGNKYTIEKTESIAEVYTLVELCFPSSCVQVEKELGRTKKPVFEMYSGDMGIYVEKKRVVREKKNGVLVMRRWR